MINAETRKDMVEENYRTADSESDELVYPTQNLTGIFRLQRINEVFIFSFLTAKPNARQGTLILIYYLKKNWFAFGFNTERCRSLLTGKRTTSHL